MDPITLRLNRSPEGFGRAMQWRLRWRDWRGAIAGTIAHLPGPVGRWGLAWRLKISDEWTEDLQALQRLARAMDLGGWIPPGDAEGNPDGAA